MATATRSRKKTKLQPLGDRVVLQREESLDTTAGGIVLPDSAQEKPQRGVIVSVGDGRLLDDGSRSELQVKPGDRVIFSSYAGDNFTIDDEEFLLMREDDILAVFCYLKKNQQYHYGDIPWPKLSPLNKKPAKRSAAALASWPAP